MSAVTSRPAGPGGGPGTMTDPDSASELARLRALESGCWRCFKMNKKLTGKALAEFEAERDVWQEVLNGVKEIKAGDGKRESAPWNSESRGGTDAPENCRAPLGSVA